MKREIEVVIVQQNGWWSAICKELQISGFGASEQDATDAFQRSLISNISARIKAAQMALPLDEAAIEENEFSDRGRGKVVRRIPLSARSRMVREAQAA